MHHNEIHKFETGKDRNFKFGTRIELGKSNLMDRKIPQKGAWWGPWAEFLNFGPRHKCENSKAKIETSNLVH